MEWRVFPGEWYLDAGMLGLALVLDMVLRELPSAIHPVVWMGRGVAWLERLGSSRGKPTMELLWGVFMAVVVPCVFGGLVWVAANGLRELGAIPYLLGGSVLLSTTFAVAGLAGAAKKVEAALGERNLDHAKSGLGSLVSRDTATLDRALVAAAAIESVAENTTDSYVAPWMAFAALGLPGAFLYRAVNTLDSMIGYRGRYEYLGKASAKLDDILNLIPARLSAVCLLVSGGVCRLPVVQGWHWSLRGRGMTASPNAGWTIGAMSGLLGVTLEKQGHYRIGAGLREPCPEDIGRSVRLGYGVAVIAAGLAIGGLALRGLLAG